MNKRLDRASFLTIRNLFALVFIIIGPRLEESGFMKDVIANSFGRYEGRFVI